MRPYDRLRMEVARKVAEIWSALSGQIVEVTVRHSPLRIRGTLIYASPAAPYIMALRRIDDEKLVVLNWTQVVSVEAPREVRITTT